MKATELLRVISSLDGYGIVVEDMDLLLCSIVSAGFEKDYASRKSVIESVLDDEN